MIPFILCVGDATDLDQSNPNVEDTENWALGFDSSISSSKTKILQYIRSEDWAEILIDSNNAHRPQLGIHYHIGFTNYDYTWTGINPTRQSEFIVNQGDLYYRYATETEFGIIRMDMNGNTEVVISAEQDQYENHLNFTFCFDIDNNLYFAYTKGNRTTSTLIIKKFDGEDIVTLASRQKYVSELTDLEENGGAWLGVYEMVFLDDFLYMIMPVARGERDIDKTAGVILYRYGIKTFQLEIIDKSDFVHFGFAGLTIHSETGDSIHDNAIYYVRSPVEIYKYPAYNPDLDSFDEETSQNYFPDFKGNLKKGFTN